MFDCLIRNLSVLDGTGRESFRADIGLNQGKIKAIGSLRAECAQTIDGAGLTVAPGFIDLHSHSDLELLRARPSDAKIRQGVTCEVLGQDGLGTTPVGPADRGLLMDLLAGLNGMLPASAWTWQSFEGYLQALTETALPVNAAVLVSHGPVRLAAMGMAQRPPTSAELAAMRRLVGDALQAGAFGFSTGLIYPPCAYGDTAELIALNRDVAAHGGIFVVHQRDEGSRLLESFDEVTRISRESGARLHVSHLQAYGKVNWPLIEPLLEKADAFVDRGPGLSWDRYPYLAGCTVLSAVLPAWTFNQGPAALVSNLKTPAFRARIHADFRKGLAVWNNRQISVGWENIIVTAVQHDAHRWMEGQSCRAIAGKLGQDPIDMVCDLLAEENLAVTMITFYGSEAVMARVLAHPRAGVGSDGIYGGRPHPRLYGAFPRFIKHFVRDNGLLSLPEAIRKITGLPAQILGIADRGVIREGAWADLVLFDPETIGDTATYEDPQRHPRGDRLGAGQR